MIISLPWPDSKLSPNSRRNRRYLSRAREQARRDGFNSALAAGADRVSLSGINPALEITFHAPDKRRRDLDNLLASLKTHLAGIASAIKRDDSEFSPIIIKRGDIGKPGSVDVQIGIFSEKKFTPIKGEVK